MKVLTIDIETRPNLALVWSLWDQTVSLDRLLESKEVMSFAAKWYDQKTTEFYSVFHNTRNEMVEAAYDLLSKADAVVHYNGARFDIPHLNSEFLLSGKTPPDPYKQIDLYKTIKATFEFPSNKLDYVAQRLGVGRKASHEGFQLWIKCLNNDPAAWERMKRYNVRDVVITEKLYDKLRPWITNHPSHAAHEGKSVCPKCGGAKVERRGYYVTRTGRYSKLHCLSPKCGAWFRQTRREDGVQITETAV